ncbi:hypothetical protein ACVCNR_03490 [Aquamicrobium terrae]
MSSLEPWSISAFCELRKHPNPLFDAIPIAKPLRTFAGIAQEAARSYPDIDDDKEAMPVARCKML